MQEHIQMLNAFTHSLLTYQNINAEKNPAEVLCAHWLCLASSRKITEEQMHVLLATLMKLQT